MDKLYANPKGEIELKFWQEKLVNSFLEANPEYNLGQRALLELVRDGTEVHFRCPVPDCWGDVICISRASDQWGCGECGSMWSPKSNLMEAIEEAEARGFQ